MGKNWIVFLKKWKKGKGGFMKVFMNANSIVPQKCHSVKTPFKSKSKEDRKNEYQKYLDKYNYITAKTSELESLALFSCIASVLLKVQNIDFSKKITTKQWLALGALSLSIILYTISTIKKSQLSKEYDKEMSK